MTGASDSALEAAGRTVAASLGHALNARLRAGLPGAITAAAAKTQTTPERLLAAVRLGDLSAVAAVAEGLLVHESYLLRDEAQLRLAVRELKRLRPGGGPLQLWSAGCAGGQEPVSLIIAAVEEGLSSDRLAVLGTDVSEEALVSARTGRFGRWSFRGVPEAMRRKYFTAEGAVRLPPGARLGFVRHNLLDPALPVPTADLICCRNVLLYFDRAAAVGIVARLARALRPGGVLVVGAAELPLVAGTGLQMLERDGSTVFVLPTQAPTPPPRPGPPPERAPAVALPPAVAPPRASGAEQCLAAALQAQASRDFEDGLRLAQRALCLDPSLATARAVMAQALEGLGRHAEAARARRLVTQSVTETEATP